MNRAACCSLLLLLAPSVVGGEVLRDSVRVAAPATDSLGSLSPRLPGMLVGTPADTAPAPQTPSKSPDLAMLLSAVLPGAGQAYNESYWKVPIVLGLGVYFISSWLDNNRRYLDYRDQYTASLQADPFGNPTLLTVREFYKDQRDSFAWYFLILYVINIADAYVDASLFSFDVGDRLALRLAPGPMPDRGIGLTVRFGIGHR